VYSREIDGQILTLAPSGWTYHRTFVLYDYETETLWYPLPGTRGLTGVAGPLKDKVLSELASDRSSWRDWLRKKPQAQHMRYRSR